LITRKSVKKV